MTGLTTYHPKPASLPASDVARVIVEASAGTGKTFFLEHRVVDLIIEQQATLPQILLVTFTDKATAELRRRIRNIIDTVERSQATEPPLDSGNAAPYWVIDATCRNRLAAARAEFGQAAIYTIHGFCQRALAEDAFAAGRLFEQTRIADETAFAVSFYELLRSEFAVEPGARAMLQQYLAAEGTVEALFATALDCARRGHASLRQPPGFTELMHAAHQLFVAVGSEAKILAFAGTGGSGTYIRNRLDELLPVLERLQATQLTMVQLLQSVYGVYDKIAELHERLTTTSVKNANDVVAALHVLSQVTSAETFLVSQWVPRIIAHMQDRKLRHGQFDFHDLLSQMWAALCGPRGDELAAAIRTRMPWVLIDEFQDTDELQWNIFRKIWLHPDAKGLTIVGDPKQSIYGFRGADVTTYLQACEHLEQAGGQYVILDRNFRSTKPMVDAVNLLLGYGEPLPLFNGDVAYTNLVSAAGFVQGDDGPAIVVMNCSTSKSKISIDKARIALRDWIASEIQRLMAAPLRWTEHGKPHVLQLSDIMIATRSNRESDAIAETLSSNGIACTRRMQERLFDSKEARDMRDVFEAIADGRDQQARIRALRTRFFSVPWSNLADAARYDDQHPAMVLLAQWRQLAAQRRFETLFHRMMEDSRFAPRTLALGGGERAIVNTQHLFELLSEYASTQRMEFVEVVQLLKGWMTGNESTRIDDSDLQRMESDGDAVQIITVHRAKGLEAAVVFWYGGDAGLPPRPVQMYLDEGQRKIAIGGKQPKAVVAKVKQQQDQENRRVAYVGVTRSKLRLYLPRLPKEAKMADAASYTPVLERIAQLQTRLADPAVAALLRFQTVELDAGESNPDTQSDDGDFEDDASSATVSAAALRRVASFVPESTAPTILAAATPTVLPPGQVAIELWSYSRLARREKAAQATPSTALASGLSVTSVGSSDGAVFGDVTDVSSRFDEVIDHDVDVSTELFDSEPRAIQAAEHGGPRVSVAALPGGADTGLFLHALLELLPIDDWRWPDCETFVADADMKALAKRCAAPNGITNDAHIAQGMTLAYACLAQSHTASNDMVLPPLRLAQSMAREVEFMFPIDAQSYRLLSRVDSAAEHGFVRGAIDAIVCWGSGEPGNSVWIIDYKSDMLRSSDVVADHAQLAAAAHQKVLDSYQLQADVYSQAASRFSAELAGVLLYFVRYQIVIAVPYENGMLLPAVAYRALTAGLL